MTRTTEERLKELRGYYAESVCKECKCEVNTAVNFDTIKRNLEMKTLLREIYDYFDVENEGVNAITYVLVEKIRATPGVINEKH